VPSVQAPLRHEQIPLKQSCPAGQAPSTQQATPGGQTHWQVASGTNGAGHSVWHCPPPWTDFVHTPPMQFRVPRQESSGAQHVRPFLPQPLA
jgi:hypothetical protein